MSAASAPAPPRVSVMEQPRRGWWLLALFLLLSLLAHGMAFYFLQIIQPSPVAMAPPPPDVTLLDLSNPANDGMRRWIEAQDPALIYASREAVPHQLLASAYQPSYAGIHSTPKAAPEETRAIPVPPARDPIAVISGAAARPAPRQAATASERSLIRLSDPLAKRGPDGAGLPGISTEAGVILEPARFLLAVTDKGGVRFSFLQRSSGDKAVDDKAEAFLRAMQFKPDAPPLVWGVANFFWGNDAYPAEGTAGAKP